MYNIHIFYENALKGRIFLNLQVQATDLAQRLRDEWLRKLWGIGGKEEKAVSGVLKGLQPEVAEVLGKVQKAVTGEIFPDQIDLLNNLLKPLLGIKESINCLFNSTDKNQTRDMEREVEMLVAQIQVSTFLFVIKKYFHIFLLSVKETHFSGVCCCSKVG